MSWTKGGTRLLKLRILRYNGRNYGKTKDSGSKPDPQLNNASMDWEEIEYKECSEDWRNRDRLIWATLPIAATIDGVLVGVAYGYIQHNKPMRFFILLIGVVLTLVMLISLVRHRMFQQGSEEQIRLLQEKLNIKGWDRRPRIHYPCHFEPLGIIPSKKFKKIDAALTNWASQEKRSGFRWMVRGTLVVMVILVALAILAWFS
jgi:hypothetical protein